MDWLIDIINDYPLLRLALLLAAFCAVMVALDLAKLICVKCWYWNGESDE